MTGISVNTRPRVKIRVNENASGALTQPTQDGVSIRTVAIDGSASGSVDQIGDLLDVDVSNPQAGETLVYNANTGKYESMILSTNVDGGEF